MTLHVNIFGQGEALVLLHGWGFEQSIWHQILPELASKYQVYLVDLPGFGLSSVMDFEPFKTQLLELIPGNFSLIGWSLGGLYATRLALEEESRVNHLINITAPPFFIDEPQWPGIEKAEFSDFYQRFSDNPEQAYNDFLQLQDKYASQLLLDYQKPINHNAFLAGLKILASWDLRTKLSDFKKPILYMFSKLDAIISPRVIKAMQSRYPRCNYHIFPQSGHIPFLSHPQEFIRTVGEFLL